MPLLPSISILYPLNACKREGTYIPGITSLYPGPEVIAILVELNRPYNVSPSLLSSPNFGHHGLSPIAKRVPADTPG